MVTLLQQAGVRALVTSRDATHRPADIVAVLPHEPHGPSVLTPVGGDPTGSIAGAYGMPLLSTSTLRADSGHERTDQPPPPSRRPKIRRHGLAIAATSAAPVVQSGEIHGGSLGPATEDTARMESEHRREASPPRRGKVTDHRVASPAVRRSKGADLANGSGLHDR